MTLKEYREKAGWTQTKLAAFAGISVQSLQRIEQNKDRIEDMKYKNLKAIWMELSIKLLPFNDTNDDPTLKPLYTLTEFVNEICK